MTILELTTAANNITDENFSTSVTKTYADKAISIINTKLKSTLPLFHATDEYTALADSWLLTVVVPHICWAIKMNDGSLNEAREYENEFQQGLFELKKNRKTAIAEVYQGTGFQSVYPITRYSGM